MISAFLFYVGCSFKNRVLHRMKRLRRPRYMVSVLAGLGYVYVFFLRPVFFGGRRGLRAGPDPELFSGNLQVVEALFSLLVAAIVIFPWLVPYKTLAVPFKEAEVQFLFPAPLSRRSLLHLRLLKAQVPILLGVVVTCVLFFARRPGHHILFTAAALWIVYSFLALYRLGTSLTQISLAEHGISGLRRQGGAIMVLGLAAAASVFWLMTYSPTVPKWAGSDPSEALAWFLRVLDSGPAAYLLMPFRWLVRPALASSVLEFVRSLPPALGLLALLYLWVARSDVAFEQASLERAEKEARRLEAARGGAPVVRGRLRRQPPLFQLSSEGAPFVALLWKNLIAAGRSGSRRARPLLAALGVVLAVMIVSGVGRGDSDVLVLGGAVAAALALATVFLGPLILREDLRTDLLHLDWLKTYPVSGRAVVLGEVLGPTAILSVIQCALVLTAAVLFPPGNRPLLSPYPRTMIALAAIILLPCLSLFGVLIQNAAVLLFPGWAHLGREHQQGVEAIGQRLLTTVGNLLLLVAAAIPGGAVFAAAFLSGYWLIGMAALPIAALAAAAGLLAEAGLMIVWMGMLFDRFDLSSEMQAGTP